MQQFSLLAQPPIKCHSVYPNTFSIIQDSVSDITIVSAYKKYEADAN
jgi:hypothetical protein